MQLMGRFSLLMLWLAAAMVAIVPGIVAADSGGVLPWTQWLISCAAAAALLLLVPALVTSGRVSSWQALSVTIGLIGMALLAGLQSLPLPSSLLSMVAPGTVEAYQSVIRTIELGPSTDAQNLSAINHPLTVSPWLTLNAAASFVVLAAFALASSQLFVTRKRVTLLLVMIALTGAIQAGLGLYQFIGDPSATVWGIKSFYGGAPFGSFINRSSAAVMMNVGLAAGLGLVAWRLAAMTGSTLDGDVFPASELLDIVFDRVAMVGIACSLLCAGGLFACGSRGGIVGMIAGLLLAFGVVQSLHRGRGIVPMIVAIGLMAAVLLINFELPATSLDRLNATSDQVLTEDGIQDGRLEHWKDGWRTAMVQPIAGWGMGSYRFAYLPFQETGGASWFVNADNLWLEWWVETGIIGVVLAVFVLVVFVQALRALNSSADPIDHGLATTGWFALGALAVSQFFDFGLRIPANSVLVAILSSTIVARASVIGYFEDDVRRNRISDEDQPNQLRKRLASFRTSSGPTVVWGVAVLVGLLFIPAMQQLDAAARGDKLYRLAKLLPRGEQFNASVASDLEAKLAEHLARHPADFNGWLERSRLTIDLARYQAAQDATKAQDAETTDWAGNFRALAPSVLRSIWYADVMGSASSKPIMQQRDEEQPNLPAEPAASSDALASQTVPMARAPLFPIAGGDSERASSDGASSERTSSMAELTPEVQRQRIAFGSAMHLGRSFAISALMACPLSDSAHLALSRLDFAGGSPAQTEALLSSVILLRNRNGQSLMAAGQLAAEAGLWKIAAEAFFAAMQREPHLTLAITTIYPEASPVSLASLLPNDNVVLAIAANQELKKTKPNVAILVRAIESLSRSMPNERTAKVQQLRLIANIHLKRNQPKLAAESLEKAVALMPGDLEARYQYALALRQSGEIAQARQQARAGRQIASSDLRFERLLAAMGETIDP